MNESDKVIRIFNTHIEVSPYKRGDSERIEKMMSTWDSGTYKFNNIGFMIDDDVLYLPRGVDIYILEKEFQTQSVFSSEKGRQLRLSHKIMSTTESRGEIQEDSIDFLNGENNFKYARQYHQRSLNLQPGDGKTYCCIRSIIFHNTKAIIITHADTIKKQWIGTCQRLFTFNKDDLVNIEGSSDIDKIIAKKMSGDIYFVNHQTLQSYRKSHGLKALSKFFDTIKVGIKVYDEAHLEFKNILRVDMFSNVNLTFYLTATFSRSDPHEDIIFTRAFSSVCKFGAETVNYEEKRRHIVYMPILYNSNCPSYISDAMIGRYGFDQKRYIDYAIYTDENKTLINKLKSMIKRLDTVDGKILIFSPKIECAEYIKKEISDVCADKLIMTIHSKNTIQHNDSAYEDADIISSTIKSCGTGKDIKGLRVVINTESFASNVTSNQMSGRLREYAPDMDTYLIDLIDISIPRVFDMYKVRTRFFKKICKKIIISK